MLLSSPVRRYIHEAFSWLHVLFAIAAIVSTYVHIPSRNVLQSPAVYVLAAFCTLVLTGGTDLLHLVFCNISWGQPFSETSIQQINFKRPGKKDITIMDAVQVHVRLSAPWVPRPGHYVYLCIPGASLTSFAQMHPFYVAW
jgi:predicted ferric reductase